MLFTWVLTIGLFLCYQWWWSETLYCERCLRALENEARLRQGPGGLSSGRGQGWGRRRPFMESNGPFWNGCHCFSSGFSISWSFLSSFLPESLTRPVCTLWTPARINSLKRTCDHVISPCRNFGWVLVTSSSARNGRTFPILPSMCSYVPSPFSHLLSIETRWDFHPFLKMPCFTHLCI